MTFEEAILLAEDVRAAGLLWRIECIENLGDDTFEVFVSPRARPEQIYILTSRTDWDHYRTREEEKIKYAHS